MKRHKLRDVCLEDFLKIKCFILVNGDRKTYCNKWSHNPHFAFPDFDVFLDPGPIEHDGPGRWNVADDPAGTDFNTLVIRTKENVFYDIRYDRNISGIQVRDNRGKEGDKLDRAFDLLVEILRHIERDSDAGEPVNPRAVGLYMRSIFLYARDGNRSLPRTLKRGVTGKSHAMRER